MFGNYYSLDLGLSISLSTIKSTYETLEKTKAYKQSGYYKEFKEFLQTYNDGLMDEVLNSQSYMFKVFLIPKVGNRRNSSDLTIDYVKLNSLTNDELKELNEKIIGIKEKTVLISSKGLMLPSVVAKKVSELTNKKFSVNDHTNAWRKYEIFSFENGVKKSQKPEYCVYEEACSKFVYTDKWVQFLVGEIEKGNL